MNSNSKIRCEWAGSDPLMISYHDTEWGVPVHDDNKLFEFLILEGAQAGLSWSTVLKKRENYRKAFDHFDPQKITRYNSEKVQVLLTDPGIIRNRLKIAAAVLNAKAFLMVQQEFGSFDKYMWQFVHNKPIKHAYRSLSEIPAKTIEAERMSKDLLKRGFTFVGPTICYAHMQAVGMVNDHLLQCFRYNEV
jgi:DNA-3-methyladenine glycosylase I